MTARARIGLKPNPSLPVPPPSESYGQQDSEAQSRPAVGSEGGKPGRAKRIVKPKVLLPDLANLHRVMALYARELEGIERQRVGMRLRIAALERDGLGAMVGTADAPGPLLDALTSLQKIEDQLERALVKMAKQHPMTPWIAAQPGVALPTFCKLFGVTGPLDRFANVEKLWHYVGMHVTNGHAPRKGEGIPGEVGGGSYSPRGAGICHVLGDTIVRANKGLWRETYDRKKAEYAVTREDWTPGHRDNAAKRYAVKMLLAEMWGEWRRVCPDDVETQMRNAAAATPTPAEALTPIT